MVSFEQSSHIVLMFPLLILNKRVTAECDVLCKACEIVSNIFRTSTLNHSSVLRDFLDWLAVILLLVFSVQHIVLDGREGIQFSKRQLPHTIGSGSVDVLKYRLCLCLNTGTLFRSRVTSDMLTCAIATEDPCN